MREAGIMDLAARQQVLQQRLRELGAKAQQIELSLVETRAEALKVAGALDLLQQLIQERDGQAAQADGGRTSPQGRAYVADGT